MEYRGLFETNLARTCWSDSSDLSGCVRPALESSVLYDFDMFPCILKV